MSGTDVPFGGRFPELVAVAAVVVAGSFLTAVAAVVVALLAAAVGGTGLVGSLLTVVLGLGLLGTAVVAAITWIAVGRARRSLGPRVADRRVRWFDRAKRLEALVPTVERFGLSSLLEPDEDAVVAAVQRRYVAGELDEEEFERELERLLGEDDVAVERWTRPDDAGGAATERLDREAGR